MNELSPDPKRKRHRGLHDYEGRKENVSNNLSPVVKAQNPIEPYKPAFANNPNEIKMNFGGGPSESEFDPNEISKHEPLPIDKAAPVEASSLFESVYVMDNDADKIKQHIKNEMENFDLAYDIARKVKICFSEEEKAILYNITFDEVFDYIKYVAFKSKMEAEIPIISLIYIEKLLRKCGVLVTIHNWRRIVLITLCIASKIWDDDSLENIHFPKVMNDITLKDISMLEKTFLNLIDYDVIIKGKEYAKYYFILTTLGEESKKNPPWKLMNPMNVAKIEGESYRMQEQLRNQHN